MYDYNKKNNNNRKESLEKYERQHKKQNNVAKQAEKSESYFGHSKKYKENPNREK